MTREEKLALLKSRLSVMEGSPKNVKCGGCVRKLKREIRNLESR